MSEQDYRKDLPRFQPENMEKNTVIFERVSTMSARKGLHGVAAGAGVGASSGERRLPDPGHQNHQGGQLDQNVAALGVRLAAEEMAELESLAAADVLRGDRFAMVQQIVPQGTR
uniref:Uncharacterized protein n=1 Tax=Oryza barthii TaxID=65489 RepID=A0A0D3FUC5_9ORYZ